MPVCRKCKIDRQTTDFAVSKNTGKRFEVCQTCIKKQIKECRYDLKRAGILKQEYDKLLAEQDGKCAICGTTTKLVVDHDHQSLCVRGLLCSNCNRGLGYLKDSIEIIEKAALYLRLRKNKQPDILQLLNRLDATSYRDL
jgi:hypothetical protein